MKPLFTDNQISLIKRIIEDSEVFDTETLMVKMPTRNIAEHLQLPSHTTVVRLFAKLKELGLASMVKPLKGHKRLQISEELI